MTAPTGDDDLGDGVDGRMMLMQCRTGDVVHLPGHHPAVVVLDDVPGPQHWARGLADLHRLARRRTAVRW
ncbi:hypothetical protein ACIBF1_30180 [Spirillospora sp. NPDC050679]